MKDQDPSLKWNLDDAKSPLAHHSDPHPRTESTAVEKIVAWGCVTMGVLATFLALVGLGVLIWLLLNIAPTAA